jgi:hypothetical protein
MDDGSRWDLQVSGRHGLRRMVIGGVGGGDVLSRSSFRVHCDGCDGGDGPRWGGWSGSSRVQR